MLRFFLRLIIVPFVIFGLVITFMPRDSLDLILGLFLIADGIAILLLGGANQDVTG